MIIEINRIYVGSGIRRKILLNMRYARKIEPVPPESPYYGLADVLIAMDDGKDETAIIYALDSYATIKGKITKAMNKRK